MLDRLYNVEAVMQEKEHSVYLSEPCFFVNRLENRLLKTCLVYVRTIKNIRRRLQIFWHNCYKLKIMLP
jgi:hypothetical protein